MPNSEPEQSWESALAAANVETDEVRREAWIEVLLNELAGADADAVVALLQGVPPPLNLDLVAGLARRHAARDPAAAAAWLSHLPEESMRAAALAQVAVAWANRDLPGATEWACALPAGTERDQAIRQVAYEAARTNPVEALILAVELPSDPAQDALIEHASLQWAGKDFEAAVQWAKKIEDNPLREKVISGVATVAAEEHPLLAATLALEALPVGSAQNNAVIGIIRRWVQTDPAAAAAWISRLPADQLGRDAVDAMVNVWSDQDAAAAGDWLLTLNAGDIRNAGSVSLSRNLERTDPALARQWREWGSVE